MYRSAYATRRTSMQRGSQRRQQINWGRNQNAVNFGREYGKRLGTASHIVTVMLIVLAMGLLYLSQTIKVTDYDHTLAEINEEVATLEAERDALAVENAKVTAVAATASNNVAASMIAADEANYARD